MCRNLVYFYRNGESFNVPENSKFKIMTMKLLIMSAIENELKLPNKA